MTSTLAWLDSSPEEHRRVQEIVRMFSQKETTDELGGRQVFVVLSDTMFPGTSVLQGRARYLLFVPWLVQRAAARTNRPLSLDRMERRLIEAFLSDQSVEAENRLVGLIGRAAGAQVKQLPSRAYWSGLTRWGILQKPCTIAEALASTAAGRGSGSDADELAERHRSTWHHGVGTAPAGFPDETLAGGFALTHHEATWIRERWLRTAEGSLLTHLAMSDHSLSDSAAPWLEPECRTAAAPMVTALDNAERFSLALEGAQRLYHLLVVEAYLDAGLSNAAVDLGTARDGLAEWATRAENSRPLFDDWKSDTFWQFVRDVNPRVNRLTQAFFDCWFQVLEHGGATSVADDKDMRSRVAEREIFLKKPAQSRLKNRKMLEAWRATEPAPTVYRWPQVWQLVTDVHNGLGVTDVRA